MDSPGVRRTSSEEPAPDVRAHAREVGQALSAALQGLSPAYREVVILKDVEGLPAEQIAQVLDEDVAAVKSRLHRARLELRQVAGRAPRRRRRPLPVSGADRILAAYVSQDIDQAACAAIEAHLSTCPNCNAACEDLQRTVSLCQRIPGDAVPEAVQRAVRHALHQRAVPAAP